MKKMRFKQWNLVLLIVILIVNVFLLNKFFPVREIFTQNIISTTDYPYHLTDIYFFKKFEIQSVFDFTYLGELKALSLIFSFISPIILYKFYVFFALFSFPLFFFLAGSELYKDKRCSVISSLVGLLIVNFSPLIKNYLTWGMFPYTFACMIFLSGAVYLYSFLILKNKIKLYIACFFLLWSLAVHPLMFFYLLILLAVCSVNSFKKSKWLAILFLGILFIFPLLMRISPSEFNQSLGFSSVKQYFSYPDMLLFFVLSVFGLVFNFGKKDKRFWFEYLLLIFLFTYFVSLIPMFFGYQIQRAMPLLLLFGLLSASVFKQSRLLFILGTVAIILSIVINGNSYAIALNKHLDFGINENTLKLKEFVANTKGNYWFEHSSTNTGHIYGNGHVLGLFTYWFYPRQMIQYSLRTNPKYRPWLYFCDGQLNETYINQTDEKVFWHTAERLNVSYVVYWSNYSKDFFRDYNKTCFGSICAVKTGIKG